MPRPLVTALSALAVAVVGVAPTSGATAPVVPPRVEKAITTATHVYDYLPSRAALGAYRYADSNVSARGVDVWFRAAGREVGFHTFAQRVVCSAGPGNEVGGPMRTFVLGGVRVYWRGTTEDHEAWRCLRARGGALVTVEATDAFFGETAASQRTLPKIVASTRWLG